MSLEISSYHGSRSKRLFDVSFASLLWTPAKIGEFGALVYLRTVLDEGDDYFVQKRDTATVKKVRTMNGSDGAFVPTKVRSKDRIPTNLAKLVRYLGIDETPQIGQVLRGELSLVGPRPLPPVTVDRCRDSVSANEFQKWCDLSKHPIVRGGIAWPAQAELIGHELEDVDFFQILIEHDIRYAVDASLAVDVSTLARTLCVMSRLGIVNTINNV